MSESRAVRLQELVEAAGELPQAERAGFLSQACGDDMTLLAEAAELLAAASPDDDFLETPAVPRAIHRHLGLPVFAPGDVLADRFQIVRCIGHGGMGEVYEANDLELGIAIALKTVRAMFASDDRIVAKFRQEVLQARAVAHGNVCKVYDLFSHQMPAGAVRFLTMELLAGITLAESLKTRGPMPIREAAAVAAQVAAALDEAHRLRIVHRDLKPGNVMLVTSGSSMRAVVTDFGLAVRVAESDPLTLSASERQAGTQHYIAPEQHTSGLLGPPADVYAFGALLHEMICGRPPDGGRSAPEVPRSWRRAINACRREDPGARPGSASAALRMALPSRRRQWALGALLVAAVLALSLYPYWSRFLKQNPQPPLRSVVLADVLNETREADLDGVTDMLRYQLTQSAILNVLEQSAVSETLARMVASADQPLSLAQAREVAWRRSADVIVSGRIRGRAPSYVLTMRFERRGAQPDVSGPNQARSFEARDRTELQHAVEEAGRWIRRAAGESTKDIPQADKPVEEVTSNSWEAVALFSRAQTLSAQSRPRDALALFEEAVRIDPDFALAWMRMGDIHMSRRATAEGYASWTKAIDAFRRRKLTTRETYRIRGMFASDTEDHAEAERVFRLYSVAYPNDFAPYFYIARPLLMLGRVDEAIQMLQMAGSKDPTAFSVPAQLAMFELQAGRLDLAAGYIATVRRLGQGSWADCIQGQLEFLRGSYDAARRTFKSLERSQDPLLRSRATALQASVLAETGRLADAIVTLQRGADADAASGDQTSRADKLLAVADLLLRSQQRQQCRDTCIIVEQIDQSPVRRARCAALLARAGFPADAETLLARLPSDLPSRRLQADRHRITAEILLARQRPRQAWDAFQRAAALEAPGVLSEYLARGAVAAGERGTALALFERMANAPGYYWRYPDNHPPGSWRAALEAYLGLAKRSTPAVDTARIAARLDGLNNPDTHPPTLDK
jgi:serine/threonine protein kinase/tetratricopeptide (TPR) repeat protein